MVPPEGPVVLVRSQFLGGGRFPSAAGRLIAWRSGPCVTSTSRSTTPGRSGVICADRPDVAVYYRQPGYLRVGYYVLVPLKMLAPGAHTLSLRAVVQGAEEVADQPHDAIRHRLIACPFPNVDGDGAEGPEVVIPCRLVDGTDAARLKADAPGREPSTARELGTAPPPAAKLVGTEKRVLILGALAGPLWEAL